MRKENIILRLCQSKASEFNLEVEPFFLITEKKNTVDIIKSYVYCALKSQKARQENFSQNNVNRKIP